MTFSPMRWRSASRTLALVAVLAVTLALSSAENGFALDTTATEVLADSWVVSTGNTKTIYALVTGSGFPPTGTVEWNDGDAGGSFDPHVLGHVERGECTLVAIPGTANAKCSVTYTAPLSLGTVTVAGDYTGDLTYEWSEGWHDLTVVAAGNVDQKQEQSCPGCCLDIPPPGAPVVGTVGQEFSVVSRKLMTGVSAVLNMSRAEVADPSYSRVNVTAIVRENTINGKEVARVDIQPTPEEACLEGDVDACYQWFFFLLEKALEIGSPYVMQLESTGDVAGTPLHAEWCYTDSDAYDGGSAILDGSPDPSMDWAFRTYTLEILPPVGSSATGGVVMPVNRFVVFAPYLALLGLVATVAVVVAVAPWKKPER